MPCAHLWLRRKNKPISCTGLKIQHGMIRRSPLFSVIGLRSCGMSDYACLPEFQIDRDIRRYLTKLCDQIVCLLSSEHSRAIVWDDENDDDALTDPDDDDSGRLYDFVVAKTNDQEENVVARPGFTVHFFMEPTVYLALTPTLLVERLTPCSLSINDLHLRYSSTARSCLQDYSMEKLPKVS
jgi:hypothetical protein